MVAKFNVSLNYRVVGNLAPWHTVISAAVNAFRQEAPVVGAIWTRFAVKSLCVTMFQIVIALLWVSDCTIQGVFGICLTSKYMEVFTDTNKLLPSLSAIPADEGLMRCFN